ncbi:hypothetical protein DPMN_165871 [Dreissena polymorpha]|uniref:Uncharacterized protein n=1 Tax=Dreissena polymorpha TaxID=45954 RepID=A0A9D4IXE4_DREPO|nr:hypothetical protein DPMN_165871 [Dreissena polymorpha]
MYPFQEISHAVCSYCANHPYEKVEPGESRQSPGTRRGYTGRAAATPRFNREQSGLHRESIQMFNTSGMNQELPERTGNDRLGTENNLDCTGNNRDGTVRAPVYVCNVAIKGLCRHSPGLHRGVAVALPGCV